ncbi:MAG: aminopeptidase [Thermoplasmata archaeon]
MLKVDLEEVAEKVVNKCMLVKEGEVILVNGGIHNFELVEDLAVNVRKLGAFPVVMAKTDRLEQRTVDEVDIEYLKRTPEYYLRWLEDIDGIISIDSSKDPRKMAALPEVKVGAARSGKRPINNKFQEEKIRWTGIGYPTKEKADMYGIDYEEFWNMFWRAVDTDYDLLRENGEKLAEKLNSGNKVHITSDNGTDLKFSIKDRHILVDDGIVSPEDVARGDIGNNLPCGEVFCAPVESSANGEAYFDLAFYRGNKIKGIHAVFKNGKLVEASAEENEEVFNEVIENSQGDKDIIGEFGIGINPEVTKAIGYTITDEKIIGSIHIAIGENRMFGGKNESTLHWDLVMLDPSFEVDGVQVMQKGEHLI